MTDAQLTRPNTGAPSPDEIKRLRQRAGRTQGELATLLHVGLRQIQRWEAGEPEMPLATWNLLRRLGGYRHACDFKIQPRYDRGYDGNKDRKDFSIKPGDFVNLEPLDGPNIQVRVLNPVRMTTSGNEVYDGLLIGFVGDSTGVSELEGFFVGERLTFSKNNVAFVEQRDK
jgi:transcriptional regulator with XRE-family HTH domain